MEKVRLSTALQSIVDQCAMFRNKYGILKAHHAAQEELIKLQKIELEKMNLHVKEIVAGFTEYKKCSNLTLRNLELENQKLKRIVDTAQDNDIRIRRENENRIHKLEGDLEKSRLQIDAESERYEKQIETMRKIHEEEIDVYKKKLEQYILQESCGEKTPMKRKHFSEKCNETENSVFPNNHEINYTHPALDDIAECKKKKIAQPPFRWPQLEITVKKEEKRKEVTKPKKKKLYQLDKEAIADLTF